MMVSVSSKDFHAFVTQMIDKYGYHNVTESAVSAVSGTPVNTVYVNGECAAEQRFDYGGGNSMLTFLTPYYNIDSDFLGEDTRHE